MACKTSFLNMILLNIHIKQYFLSYINFSVYISLYLVSNFLTHGICCLQVLNHTTSFITKLNILIDVNITFKKVLVNNQGPRNDQRGMYSH